MDKALSNLFDCILGGHKAGVEIAVREALDTKYQADRVLFEAMIPAMDEAGKLYEKGEYFIPEMLVAAKAMRAGLEVLKSYLVEEGVQPMGKVAIGTVKGDLRDIGKNLVAIMLEGGGGPGFGSGGGCPGGEIHRGHTIWSGYRGNVRIAHHHHAQLQINIEKFEQANLRDKVMIIIGGAPV